MITHTKVTFRTEDAALQRLYDEAERKALNNLNMFGPDQVLVEGGGYEKIWLETQPMGGEMYAKRNMTAAMNDQLLFMRTQREDGRLPGSIQCHPDGRVEPQFNKLQGFCFPLHALNMYYLCGRDPAYLDQLAVTLARFDRWLWQVRDSNGDGLLESWCVYDTGEDNALRYGDAPCYWTEDTAPTGFSVVPMASMDFMSFSYSCRETLAHISRLRKDGQEEAWTQKARQVAEAIRDHMWDEERGACFDRDHTGRVLPTLTHNNLRCMYWGSFSQEMADRFVREHLLNPEEFMTELPIPSVAVNDPLFRNAPENNWSGQTEALTLQRAIIALERYGYEPLVTRLGRRYLRAVIEGGYVFTQQYDPFTGVPSRVGMYSHEVLAPGSEEPFQDSYGPAILSVLEYIAHMWGVHIALGEVWFSLATADAPYDYEQQWGGHVYRIQSDGVRAAVFADGRALGEYDCGIRVVTDENGAVLRTLPIE